MIEIIDAIRAALVANTELVRLVGSADAITAQWPDQNAEFSQPPAGDDYSGLGAVDTPRARVPIVRVAAVLADAIVGVRDEDYQVSVFSYSDRFNSRLAELIQGTLNTHPCDPAGVIVNEQYCGDAGAQSYDQPTRLFQQNLTVNLTWLRRLTS